MNCTARCTNTQYYPLYLRGVTTEHQAKICASANFTMQICFGTDKHPIFMSATRDYKLFELMETCRSFHTNGTPLHLEYHPSLYLNLPNEVLLEFACQMVVEYHNHLLHTMHPDVWEPAFIASAERSVQELLSDDEDSAWTQYEESSEDEDTELTEEPRRPIDHTPFNCRPKRGYTKNQNNSTM